MPYSEQDCIDALQQASEQLGSKSFSYPEYKTTKISPTSDDTFRRVFGSWNAAKEAAGLETSGGPVTEQDCIDSLLRLANDLGHSPTYDEYLAADTLVSKTAIENRFDTFNRGKAAAGLDTTEMWKRTRDVDEDYFNEIDTAEKAYWLGFIVGDGSVVEWEERGGTRLKFSMSLQESDRPHLEAFNSAVDSTYPVRSRSRHTEYVELQITNKDFAESLIGQGVVPRKAREGAAMDPPEDHFWPFVRGWFDADGHIHETQSKVTIAGTNKPQMSALGQQLSERGILTTTDTYEKKKKNEHDATHIRISGGDVESFNEHVYPIGSRTEPKLDRKYYRF